jgi:hypothetical protein
MPNKFSIIHSISKAINITFPLRPNQSPNDTLETDMRQNHLTVETITKYNGFK